MSFIRKLAWALSIGGVVVLCASFAQATEIIITNPMKSQDDKRFEYPKEILKTALKRTEDRYGPFDIQRYAAGLSRNRALRELVSGNITIFEAPTRLEWEEAAIPVRVPIRKGLLGYKLLLIRNDRQADFDKIETQEQLKQYRYGGGLQWSSSLAMKRLGFKIHGGTDYEPLFAMLHGRRFDYFPRGVNEIFQEFDTRKGKFPDMVIEKKLALYLPQPTYFFVTPTKPLLAKRLKEGLLSMVDDGTLDQMFLEYHGASLERAGLQNRKIIQLKNYNLSDETPFHREDLWYQPKK